MSKFFTVEDTARLDPFRPQSEDSLTLARLSANFDLAVHDSPEEDPMDAANAILKPYVDPESLVYMAKLRIGTIRSMLIEAGAPPQIVQLLETAVLASYTEAFVVANKFRDERERA